MPEATPNGTVAKRIAAATKLSNCAASTKRMMITAKPKVVRTPLDV